MPYIDIPSFYKVLKKRIEGKYFPNPNKNNSYFAFTSKAVEDVVLNKYSSFVKDGGFKRLRYVIGEGLFTGEEPRHMIKKKEIYPAFNHSRVVEYEATTNSIIDEILSTWSEKVDVRTEMQFFVFKSIMQIFFSENIDYEFIKIKDSVFTISDKIAFDVQDDELKALTKELKEITKRVIDKRLNSKENKNDFLGILVNSYNNGTMTIDDLYDESLTIILGSYETTAYSLEWAVYYLSINKKWQEKISREEDVDAFVNEVLRMCPPIWNSERLAVEDVDIDGSHIPSGTKVILSSLTTQRDANIFKDPNIFKPERWLENLELSKGEYFPFLFGKRQCIGKEFALMEMRVVLTKIAKKFNIELENKEVSYDFAMSYRPRDAIFINVREK